MQPNPQSFNRSGLFSAAHSKSYDPSAPYRERLNPPAPVTTEIPYNNQYSANPNISDEVPFTNIDPKTGVIKRIPQFFYPRYNQPDGPPVTYPNVQPPPPPPPPPVMEQPAPNQLVPHSQPFQLPMDPYNPYYTPYLIPLMNNAPPDPVPSYQDQSKADVLAAHQKDADLSRLEVYHFTPKNNSSGLGTSQVGQPIIQYHVYPYPPGGAPPPPPLPPQQQYPPYPQPWQPYPPNVPYLTELPMIETKARGSQTEPPSTKNRGISPMYFPEIPVPGYDEESYPYIQQRSMHTDRYNLQTARINPQFSYHKSSLPLDDCRCLDCQRERGKVLNYYPD